MASRRSALVALITHTSTGSVRVPPRRRTVRSSTTLSSLAWSGSLSSPTSSRKMVPVWAAWNSPGLACWAPVNAPRSKPKSSDSMSVSGMAAQLTATKGRAARGPWRCRRLATSPLPAPVSPDSSTAGNRPVPAALRRSRRMLARRVSMAGLAPSNTSGALIRAVSYLSLRVGYPARSGAEDAAGALRRRHELARQGHLHGDDRVEASAAHGHAAVAEHAKPIVGQERAEQVAGTSACVASGRGVPHPQVGVQVEALHVRLARATCSLLQLGA